MSRHHLVHAMVMLLLAVLVGDLAACGRKGPPVAPGEEEPESRGTR
jgi:predicted small lipoprotein YifL